MVSHPPHCTSGELSPASISQPLLQDSMHLKQYYSMPLQGLLDIRIWLAAQSLLGDPGTRRSLRRAVARLIRLRRYEHMTVQHALCRLRASQIHALWPGELDSLCAPGCRC